QATIGPARPGPALRAFPPPAPVCRTPPRKDRSMSRASLPAVALPVVVSALAVLSAFAQPAKPDDSLLGPIHVEAPPVSSDPAVRLAYDLVYVRAPRRGDAVGTTWAEISSPVFLDPGADLMLLHPDGKEEVLVAGGKGSVADPVVSFDGEWVYYALFHDL